jgi:phage FluMu protein Com
MKEYRCPVCKKLLFKGLFDGVIEIKCKCGLMAKLEGVLKK